MTKLFEEAIRSIARKREVNVFQVGEDAVRVTFVVNDGRTGVAMATFDRGAIHINDYLAGLLAGRGWETFRLYGARYFLPSVCKAHGFEADGTTPRLN